MNDFFSFVINNDNDRKDHDDDLVIILYDLQIEVYFVKFLSFCKVFLREYFIKNIYFVAITNPYH